MRALVIAEAEGPSGLQLKEIEAPQPQKGELLVKVKAAGLNRADLLQTLGLYPAPPGYPDVPGLEFCGEVLSGGPGFKKGERVMGLTPAGAFAEQLAIDCKQVIKVPKSMSDTEAAAVVEAFSTAWDAAWLQAKVKKGQRLLIHAVGSGVGTAAVQLARAFKVVSVGTSRTQKKLDQSGCDEKVLVEEPSSFASRCGAPIDVCLDLVGGAYFAETLEAMAPRGTVMVVGLTAGPSAEVPLRTVLSKRLHVIGTTLRSRGPKERAALAQGFTRTLLPLFKQGHLKAEVGVVKPFSEARAAFEAMASNDTYGKTVLTW
ncbi:MAG: NAD(P)H-quinone oxidoreductase [Archangiaceae bacterium]|nr:NAD(P)H-quinone oxidoreductase [Archangiaceae bacterium]